MKQGAMS